VPRDRFWTPVLGTWALATVMMLLTTLPAIVGWRFPDPDDTLRLLEARDLLNGQSWWDVSQHRLSSGQMHWSRLADLPLVAAMALARPLLGAMGTETAALVAVPLFTLLVVMALVGWLTRRLLDAERMAYALLIVPLSVPLVEQLRPMRIDHHGWQIASALLALCALTMPGRRAAALGGAALGVLLTISLEGLPVAAALIGIVALGWVIEPARRTQPVAASAALFATALALHVATRGPGMWRPAGDAMAPAWLTGLGVGAIGIAAVVGIAARTLALRLAGLALAAIAAGAAVLLVDPASLAGPFGRLDPLVRTLWYERVMEGLPIWRQDPVTALMQAGMPLVALYGGWRALKAAEGERRAAWWIVLGAQAAAFALSLLVARAAATANAFAAPGAAFVLVGLLTRARQVVRTGPRIAATVGALVAVTPGLVLSPLLLVADKAMARQTLRTLPRGRPPCLQSEDARAVGLLPAGRLFVPMDLAPDLIATTRHRAIASGHHRNVAAMHDVIAGFTASPERARAIVARYRPDYLVGCPGLPETQLYDQVAPHGLWARLERGERFSWLEPVPIRNSPVLVWRVTPLPEPVAAP